MNKQAYFERMKNYNDFALTQNPRHTPVKGESTGTYGRDFESRVRYLIGNYRAKNFISEKSGIDTTKKINGKSYKFEIKNRCSTIGNYKKGYDEFPFLNSDFVLYAMDYIPEQTFDEIARNTFCIPSACFMDILKSLNLIRNNSKRLEYQIQVFYTSKKKTAAFEKALSEYPTIAEIF